MHGKQNYVIWYLNHSSFVFMNIKESVDIFMNMEGQLTFASYLSTLMLKHLVYQKYPLRSREVHSYSTSDPWYKMNNCCRWYSSCQHPRRHINFANISKHASQPHTEEQVLEHE